MSKQLRLDVAQLTDVGRKRPHNEDNMAYVIPKDPQAMARKGALFIVADGMGGHAAGEVASEIAVDTVSKVYYQDDSDDVAVSLLHAIRHANTLIHQRAAENMLRSGMGTTCVAAVLRGSTAYIANVGDSRAYLIRKGQVKQVSQDHSWVEEQVRAGLLTRDQARSHAQRNVITRCLGTQAEVEIDVFSEPLEEGDSMILCTDGLSGLVSDDELQAIVSQYVPQESVYHLVERANENGGPDNITAIVIRVQEVGWEPPGVRPAVRVGGREADEDTAVIGQFRGSAPLGLPQRSNDGRIPSAPLRMNSGPLASPDSVTTPQPILPLEPPARRHNRLFYPSLALFVVLLVALVGGGAYYFWDRYHSQTTIDASLKTASTLITQATNEAQSQPGDALQKLNQAQQSLLTAKNGSLNDTQHTQLTNLQQNLTVTTKTTIKNYNQQSSISSLPCPGTTSPALNSGTSNTVPRSVVAVRNGKNNVFYALGEDHALYQVDQQQNLGNKVNLANGAQLLMIAGDQTRLVSLASITSQGKPASFQIYLVLPNGNKTVSASIDSALTKEGRTPTLITAWGDDVYVVLAPPAAPASAIILDYAIKNDNFQGAPRKSMISISTSLVSLAAFPNHQLFLLFDDGSVSNLPFAGSDRTSVNQVAASVVLQQSQAIAPTLPTDAEQFTPTTTVPTPVVQSARSPLVLSVPGATLLAAGMADNNTSHLYVVDEQYHRVLELMQAPSTTGTATPTSTKGATGGGVGAQIGMKLFQQYTSPTLLARMKSIAADPANPQIYVLAQGGRTAALNLVSINTHQPDPNACPVSAPA